MTSADIGPRAGEELHEINAEFAELVSQQLGFPVTLSTLRYGYRRGTATPQGRVRLGVLKFGRTVVSSVKAVRRWAGAVAAASAFDGIEVTTASDDSARSSTARVRQAEEVLRAEGLL